MSRWPLRTRLALPILSMRSTTILEERQTSGQRGIFTNLGTVLHTAFIETYRSSN